MGSEMCIFFHAEDGIRDVERSRGLGDVYKRQVSLLLRPSRRKRKPLLIMSPGVWVKMVAWGKVEGVGERVGWMKDCKSS